MISFRAQRDNLSSASGCLSEQGFTLIEVLAALSVFAIAAIGLIHVTSENSKGAQLIENRMLASIVADNEMTLSLVQREEFKEGVSTGQSKLGGIDWNWRKSISKTPNPLIKEISVEVFASTVGDEETYVLVSLSAYKGTSK